MWSVDFVFDQKNISYDNSSFQQMILVLKCPLQPHLHVRYTIGSTM